MYFADQASSQIPRERENETEPIFKAGPRPEFRYDRGTYYCFRGGCTGRGGGLI